MSDNIHLGKAVTPFVIIGDSKAIARTASDFFKCQKK